MTDPAELYLSDDLLPRTLGMFILPVHAWGEALSFYRDVLGWPLLHEEPGVWAEFQTGGARVALRGRGVREPPPPIDTHLSFRVADVDATLAALRARGVEVLAGPFPVGEGVRGLSFADPFGNQLHLTGR